MKKTMGRIISENRKAKGMTQLELAERLGITDKAVSKWERDLSCPDLSSLPQLAQILGISLDELMQVQKTSPDPVSKNFSQPLDVALKGVGLAMGIAVAVLNILGELSVKDGMTMLAIGLSCISVSLLSKN